MQIGITPSGRLLVLLNKGEKLAEGDAKEMVNLYRRVLVNQYDEPGEQNTMQEETPEVQEEKSTKDQLNLNPKEYQSDRDSDRAGIFPV